MVVHDGLKMVCNICFKRLLLCKLDFRRKFQRIYLCIIIRTYSFDNPGRENITNTRVACTDVNVYFYVTNFQFSDYVYNKLNKFEDVECHIRRRTSASALYFIVDHTNRKVRRISLCKNVDDSTDSCSIKAADINRARSFAPVLHNRNLSMVS